MTNVAASVRARLLKRSKDMQALAARLEFDGTRLTEAIHGTFQRRGVTIGELLPPPAAEEFAVDAMMRRRWDGFLRRNRVEAVSLEQVVASLRAFLLEPWTALASDAPFTAHWPAGGPWLVPPGA